jgi:hypothetical protein
VAVGAHGLAFAVHDGRAQCSIGKPLKLLKENPEARVPQALEDALSLSRAPAIFKMNDKKPILEIDQAFQVKPQ